MKKSYLSLFVVVLMLTACAINPDIPNFIGSTQTPYVITATQAATSIPTLAPTAAPTLVPTQVPTAAPTLAPTSTPIAKPTTTTNLVAGPKLAKKGTLFQTPVKCSKKFNDESKWIICEPGVLLDNTTAWTIGQVKAPYFVNVPEGTFTYFSMGEGDITIDGVTLKLKGENGLNYLVLMRGKPDDGIVDSDLNMTAEVTNFVPGHAIWSHTPTGAYISADWFRQQLVASSTGGYTNCGATGCSRVRVILFDVSSHYYQMFEIQANNLDKWQLVEHN